MSRPLSFGVGGQSESAVDQKCRDVSKESSEHLRDIGGEATFIDRVVHQEHPAITGGLSDCEGSMASAQGRVASLVQIVLRTTEAKRQKHPQAFFSPAKVFGWIHGSEQLIGGDAAIEGGCQSLNTVGTEQSVQVVFGDVRIGGGVIHGRDCRCRWVVLL